MRAVATARRGRRRARSLARSPAYPVRGPQFATKDQAADERIEQDNAAAEHLAENMGRRVTLSAPQPAGHGSSNVAIAPALHLVLAGVGQNQAKEAERVCLRT